MRKPSLMSLPPSTNTYQIAGLDDLERGFNRQIEVHYIEDHYQANFRYEKLFMSAELIAPKLPKVQLNLAYSLEVQGYIKNAVEHYYTFLALTEGKNSYRATRKKVLERIIQLENT